MAANLRAIMAAVVTHLAACVGGLAWCLMDYRYERKWSTVGFCSGVVSGLVAITPAAGYVPPWAAVIFGICAGTYLCVRYADVLLGHFHISTCVLLWLKHLLTFSFRF